MFVAFRVTLRIRRRVCLDLVFRTFLFVFYVTYRNCLYFATRVDGPHAAFRILRVLFYATWFFEGGAGAFIGGFDDFLDRLVLIVVNVSVVRFGRFVSVVSAAPNVYVFR